MTNGYLDAKVVWYRNNQSTDQVELTNIISLSSSENNKPLNNMVSIRVPRDDNLIVSGTFVPKENDVVLIYVKKVVHSDDVDFTDSDILMTGKYVDYQKKTDPTSDTITLKIADWGYDIFNQYEKKSYYDSGLRTPFVIADSIREKSEEVSGSGGFKLDVLFVGYPRKDGIQVTRPNSGDQSAIEFTWDDYLNNTAAYQAYTALSESWKFPVIKPALQLKPMNTFLNEMSNVGYTNTEAELSSDPLTRRSYVFRINGTRPIWYYPSVTEDYIINEDDEILDISEKSTNEASTNFLILDCGSDFNDRPIHAFIQNTKSESSVKKEASEKKEALGGGNTTYDQTYHQLKSEFTSGTNTEFRQAVRDAAETYGEVWFEIFGKGETENRISVGYYPYRYGEIVRVDLENYSNTLYKVESVAHSISKKAATTTLSLKEFTGE